MSEPDLVDKVIRARLERCGLREQLWANGEITISGLRRFDRVFGFDTYNQCDGCMRGLPLVGRVHVGSNGYDYIGCTAERYTEASDDQ